MGFRRPRRPVIPGKEWPAERTNSRNDPKIRVTRTLHAGRYGIRSECGRCGAKEVEVTQSTNEDGHALAAWYYSPHLAPERSA